MLLLLLLLVAQRLLLSSLLRLRLLLLLGLLPSLLRLLLLLTSKPPSTCWRRQLMGLRCCCCPQNDHERNIGRWLEEGGGGPLLAAGIGRSPVAGLAASVGFLFGWPNAGSNSRRKAVPVLALAPLSQQCAHGMVQHGAARCSTSPPGGATAPQGSGGWPCGSRSFWVRTAERRVKLAEYSGSSDRACPTRLHMQAEGGGGGYSSTQPAAGIGRSPAAGLLLLLMMMMMR